MMAASRSVNMSFFLFITRLGIARLSQPELVPSRLKNETQGDSRRRVIAASSSWRRVGRVISDLADTSNTGLKSANTSNIGSLAQ